MVKTPAEKAGMWMGLALASWAVLAIIVIGTVKIVQFLF